MGLLEILRRRGILRSFYAWCRKDLGINTGEFYKSFHILNEDIQIVTLSLEQLNFLVFDQEFEAGLPLHLRRTKDVFVFGCSTGLRVSDLRRLKPQHVVIRDGITYLQISNKKTGQESLIRLAPWCLDIIARYRKLRKRLLPVTINTRFNSYLKLLCNRAGWNWEVPRYRKSGNKTIETKKSNKSYRFCDLVSSHTMRRTCITCMLYSGMSEHVVRRISGHVGNSKSFYRYVDLAQKLVDQEIDKLFERVSTSKKVTENGSFIAKMM